MKSNKIYHLIISIAIAAAFISPFTLTDYYAQDRNNPSIAPGLQDSTTRNNNMQNNGMMKVMHDMHGNIKDIEKTGDPDNDFAAMMIEHHKGSIDMSDVYMENGKDKQLKKIAANTKKSQTKDIKKLQKYTDGNTHAQTSRRQDQPDMNREQDQVTGSEKRETGQRSEMMSSVDNMMEDMSDMKMTGDHDQDFAQMMIRHHQGAIDMSKEYLKSGENKNLKSLASKMIGENQKEIDKLKDWQTTHK